MLALKTYHAAKLHPLPDPLDDIGPWARLMADFPSAWRRLVDTYIVYASPLEGRGASDGDAYDGDARLCCDICAAAGERSAFSSDR
eukprot:15443030-Heterocapsa_arctica.AAC.1